MWTRKQETPQSSCTEQSDQKGKVTLKASPKHLHEQMRSQLKEIQKQSDKEEEEKRRCRVVLQPAKKPEITSEDIQKAVREAMQAERERLIAQEAEKLEYGKKGK